jgi:predicted ATPase
MPTLIAITGGPGAGKTTLINRLHDLGFPVMPECGRALIKDRIAIGAPHPNPDPVLEGELALMWELRSFHEAQRFPGPVFFDHALPGLLAHYSQIGRPTPTHIAKAVATFRFHPVVLVAPPWPEIYCNDDERTQTWAQACAVYDAICEAYRRGGYSLLELPRACVDERVEFIRDRYQLSLE